MILNSTSDLIRLRLDATVATNELPWVTAYNDHTTTTFVPGDSDGASNGTTNVTIVGSPSASTQRQVTSINVYNADTVARGVIIEKYDGSNGRILCNCVLAVGDTLYWSREAGWTVLKTDTTTSSYILQEYIANATWNKPANIKAALMVAVGAGGGGGSGARNAAGTNRYGGGGAGGAAIVWTMVQGASLASSYAITVGTGGTGGAAQTSDTTNGNAGTAGGDSLIGVLVRAKGGGQGSGGTTTTGNPGNGGQPSAAVPSYGPYALSGMPGATGVTTTNTAVSTAFAGTGGAGGGNGGRGISSANVNGTGTLTISGIYVNGTVVGATTTPSTNGLDDLALSLLFSSATTGTYGPGTGGNGGNVAGAAGNGGRCSGGGGGGGSLNGTNSGKGGDGGGGLVQILEIY